MTRIQQVAWIFAVLFFVVFAITNIPAFNDAQGYNFGLFKIDPIDNVVHLLTAIIGALAAWCSAKWSRWFLVVFGIFYGLDALVGLLAQKGLLDLSIFLQAASDSSKLWNPDVGIRNFLVNGPHIGISAAMVSAGTWLYGWVSSRKSFLQLFMVWNIFRA